MIDLYTWATPNGFKASIMLEECRLPYEVVPIDITKGDQHTPAFRAVNPNGKIPAIVDRSAELTIFESGAILTYLAEETGQLLPTSKKDRLETLQWLSWQIGGVGPMFGQASFFIRRASENTQAIDRYVAESNRLLDVAEGRLGQANYFAGNDYTIADIMIFPWVSIARSFLDTPEKPWDERPNLLRWLAQVGQREAVQAGMAIPFPHKPPSESQPSRGHNIHETDLAR